MALTYCSLASGSSGNCLWVRSNGVDLLVDCGISARRIGEKLAAVDSSLERIAAVVCTHSHHDHVAGAATLTRRYGLDVWATPPTERLLARTCARGRLRTLAARGLRIGGLEVTTVPTPHDAPGSVALVIRDSESALAVITDLGKSTPEIVAAAQSVDALVLEANHDEEMLRDGPYPEWLKRRIRGPYGHLSNNQAAALLGALAHPGLQHVMLAHISEHNNAPEMARVTIEALLASRWPAARLDLALREGTREPVEIRPRTAAGQLRMPWA